MKKILFLLVFAAVAFSLCACNQADGVYTIAIARSPAPATELNLTETTTVKNKIKNVMLPYSAEFVDAFLRSQGKENTVCSPLSAYFALSLAAEVTCGTSRDEILSAIQISDVDMLREYADLIYSASTKERTVYDGKEKTISREVVTNSLWLDPDAIWNENILDALAKQHHAFAVNASFRNDNVNSNKALSEFIRQESHGLLNPQMKIPNDTLMLLVNTLYVSDCWNYSGDLPFTENTYSFANQNGSVKEIKLLHMPERAGKLLETEKYAAFPATTESNFRLHFIVPNDGYKIDEIMNGQTVTEVLSDKYAAYSDDGTVRHLTTVLFPEYSVENSISLTSVLNTLGVKTAFGRNADFSAFSPNVGLKFTDTVQMNKLTVNKRGIEGASATILMAATSMPPQMETVRKTLIVDRPFGFILTDAYNIPLFCGIIYNI